MVQLSPHTIPSSPFVRLAFDGKRAMSSAVEQQLVSGERRGLNLGSSVLTADQVICGLLRGGRSGERVHKIAAVVYICVRTAYSFVAEDAEIAARSKRQLWSPSEMFHVTVYWDLDAL